MNILLDDSNHKPFDFKDFYSLDESEDMEYLMASMDQMFALSTIRAIKRRAISLLNVTRGDSVIEIGCGLGHDSETIGEIVGSDGKVVAIDSSKMMLQEAKKRSSQPHVNYEHSHGESISYPDCSFSASYADRLLVSQKDPLKVLNELVRVVKPGGKVCITDIDVGSAIISPNHGRLTNMLFTRLAEVIENPYIGRDLHVMFKQAGLKDLQVFPESYVVRSFKQVNTMIDFPRIIVDLYKQEKYTREEAELISNSFCDADSKGDFLYSIILFTVVGTKV